MSESSQLTIIHWTETLDKGGNPYILKPKPEMLLEGGTRIVRRFGKLGRGVIPNVEAEFFSVVYDQSYVTHYILQNIVNCFPGITHTQMREQFTFALKLRRQLEENEQTETIKNV